MALARSLEARTFRNLAALEAPLAAGITIVHGENGAGKTNLLEALHFALTGRSFRTRTDRELIAWGEPIARAALRLEEESAEREIAAAISRDGEKRRSVDGTDRTSDPALTPRPSVAVFSPDRLDLAKGEPRVRRSHLDQFTSAWRPARRDLRRRYSAALAQRNALLARVRSGLSAPGELDAWDRELSATGSELTSLRREACGSLSPLFADSGNELGLPGAAALRYSPSFEGTPDEMAAALAERRSSDVERGFTGIGPHRDELHLELDGRSLRRYGSQGQQRLAVLALLLAEREALAGESIPLLLLDDVMSELDAGRRELLIGRLGSQGQALLTTADPDHVPEAPGSLTLEIAAGELVGERVG